MSAQQGPEGPGALVIRSQLGAFLTLSDPDPGLTALIGWTFAELEQFCTTDDRLPSRLEELVVIRPHSTEELPDLHVRLRGTRVPLLVWEVTIPFIDPLAELCGDLFPLPHLAGTGNFINRDNDAFSTGSRGIAAGFGIHGQVASEATEPFKFSGTFHLVITPSGHERFTLDLELKPIGS